MGSSANSELKIVPFMEFWQPPRNSWLLQVFSGREMRLWALREKTIVSYTKCKIVAHAEVVTEGRVFFCQTITRLGFRTLRFQL